MKYTHVLWDFNGTILDDVKVGIDSINVLLKRRGLRKFDSVEEYREVFGFPIIEYYRRIGFDFEKESYSDVAVEWVDEYLARVPDAPAINGSVELVKRLRSLGLKQVVVSATESKMLKSQLSSLGLLELFDEIYGLDNIQAHTKTAVAEAWRKQNADAKALFVGDTDHDFETACAIGADCILFCGGHQSKERLEKLGCRVVESVFEIEALVV